MQACSAARPHQLTAVVAARSLTATTIHRATVSFVLIIHLRAGAELPALVLTQFFGLKKSLFSRIVTATETTVACAHVPCRQTTLHLTYSLIG